MFFKNFGMIIFLNWNITYKFLREVLLKVIDDSNKLKA